MDEIIGSKKWVQNNWVGVSSLNTNSEKKEDINKNQKLEKYSFPLEFFLIQKSAEITLFVRTGVDKHPRS